MTDDLHADDQIVHYGPASSGTAPLAESLIKECWRENALGAADDAAQLSVLPHVASLQGPIYERMRGRLKLAEGACRQMCHWREDARWLYLAPKIETLHQMTLEMVTMRAAQELFLKLADTLRNLVIIMDGLENRRTGRVGMILPEPQPLDRTEGRPVQVLAAS